jgi:5-oxoprolinase (ATP-hydrolysing) subunit A
MNIILNCDMGEGLGEGDALIMPFIDAANIACGFHAGNEETMKRTVELAMRHGVAVGAHPSFHDKDNFGRIEVEWDEEEVYHLMREQISLFNAVVREAGAVFNHVKPHGALYNMASRDAQLAAIIAKSIRDFNPAIILFGLSGSHLVNEAKKIGLKTMSEVFADRTYQDDGSLTPRSVDNAMIVDADKGLQQVWQMVTTGTVQTISGKTIPIVAETVCIHGDGKHAVAFAQKLAANFST